MSRVALLNKLDPNRLRLLLAFIFLALAIPTMVLIIHAYRQLKWESLHQYRIMAQEYHQRMDQQLRQLIQTEEARPFTDYSFLNVVGDSTTNFFQRSPLSTYPVNSSIPGLLGYFQVDHEGVFSSPLMPTSLAIAGPYGLSEKERRQRQQVQQHLLQILARNRLVSQRQNVGNNQLAPPPRSQAPIAQEGIAPGAGDILANGPLAAPTTPALERESRAGPGRIAHPEDQANSPTYTEDTAEKKEPANGFDSLQNKTYTAQRKRPAAPVPIPKSDEEITFENEIASVQAKPGNNDPVSQRIPPNRIQRLEKNVIPESVDSESLDIRIRMFDSAIDPFQFSRLNSGHFVLYRQVWREDQRYYQGAVINTRDFVEGLFKASFYATALAGMSSLALNYQDESIAGFLATSAQGFSASYDSNTELSGDVLYAAHFSAPLSELRLELLIDHLPSGPSLHLIGWLSTLIALVLCGGFYFIYCLGLRQLALNEQQQDFVAAVSHELKTPLTSIRMYGEMLRSGWVNEDKRNTYYTYIHDESERLSRLIDNVLQLARMSHNKLSLDIQAITVESLLDLIQSKVARQIEQTGFKLSAHIDPRIAGQSLAIDRDAFTQIIINLVDNAIKFSAKAAQKNIELSMVPRGENGIDIHIRDYGPGIPRDQIKKIFKLFYRSENELTRETVGTGIGLALVHQLTSAMNGTVDVCNVEPGARFTLSLTKYPI